MSPPKPCTGRLNGRCDVAVVAASNAGDLPLDALYEILLCLPVLAVPPLGPVVCRRARRPWPRPPEPPLIITGFYSNASEAEGRHVPGSVANIMDLSGRIVKQVRMDGHRVMSMPLNLACVRSIADGTCRLLDPATYNTTDAAAAAMRYYVCTLSGGGGRPRWRAVQGPPDTFCQTRGTGVAIGGVVYLLIAAVYFGVRNKNPDVQRDWIYSFDLETEKWLPNIKGPPQQGFVFIDNPAAPPKFLRFSLANLNGSLVIVHGPSPETNMDLWFLMDSEKSLWVKQYSMVQLTMERLPGYFQPLVVLDDGTIVVITTCATVAEMGRCCIQS
ncbi:unnamed protein product [Miscanthus lutarioriparius]|uniref:F-box associated beta-propeller type 3 domain-containing protein n=1 Tax=Miscanthus lutarioriparius TaxID=422564 RepID=A0A811PZS2_9POAL|nr:unnamed protein product [Miscanthus lutarioriparius]